MSALTLRPVKHTDARLLLDWRNDSVVRENSLSSDDISWSTHLRWLEKKLNSPDCRIWLLEQSGTPVGQIRFDREGVFAIISLSIASEFRRRGFGSTLLELSASRACRELEVEHLVGIVKADNQASRSAFARAGFREVASLQVDGQNCVRFELPCSADRAA